MTRLMRTTFKKIFCLLACSIASFGFSSCGEDDEPVLGMIWDFIPIEIYITLTGENGADLLNPETPGSYAALATTATFRDKTYAKDEFKEDDMQKTRFYMPTMYGIRTFLRNDGRYALVFGELDKTMIYKDEKLTIDWGNGTQDVITFSSRIKWKGDKTDTISSYKLNGKEAAKDTSHPTIDIRK
ncbi:MAG: hypothetical protein Q4F52_01585 [Bacteroidaceae bacterium]|nr:hypothetical protein [Bacteroidaceae bacterium]